MPHLLKSPPHQNSAWDQAFSHEPLGNTQVNIQSAAARYRTIQLAIMRVIKERECKQERCPLLKTFYILLTLNYANMIEHLFKRLN
jgi:hypothetical protein